MQSLLITGRRWFERRNGNTYFSAKAYIDGRCVAVIPFRYGYGSQYKHEMFYMLKSAGLLPGDVSEMGSAYTWCQRNGITYEDDVVDVQRKKDL